MIDNSADSAERIKVSFCGVETRDSRTLGSDNDVDLENPISNRQHCVLTVLSAYK
jgi:hypothetical protein